MLYEVSRNLMETMPASKTVQYENYVIDPKIESREFQHTMISNKIDYLKNKINYNKEEFNKH
jgi:hypothetical protein